MAAPKKKDETVEAKAVETTEVETTEAPKAPRLSAVERLAKQLAEAQAKEEEKTRVALDKAKAELEKADAAVLKATERQLAAHARVTELRNQLTPVVSDTASYAAVLTPAPALTEEQAEAQLFELENAPV